MPKKMIIVAPAESAGQRCRRLVDVGGLLREWSARAGGRPGSPPSASRAPGPSFASQRDSVASSRPCARCGAVEASGDGLDMRLEPAALAGLVMAFRMMRH